MPDELRSMIERDRFGTVRLARNWVRIGTNGREMVEVFADELDLSLLPKVGYQGMPKGEQGEVLTPGPNEKRYLAGALDVATGTISPWVW